MYKHPCNSAIDSVLEGGAGIGDHYQSSLYTIGHDMVVIMLFPWSLLLFFPSFLIPAVLSSSVRVDSSLSSLLLRSTNLPLPHLPGELSVTLQSRQLVGAGFHRTLLTQVEQVSSPDHSIPDHSSALRVAIVENITCDMYVDIDQVRTINFIKSIRA